MAAGMAAGSASLKGFAASAMAASAAMKSLGMSVMMVAAGIAVAFAPILIMGGKFERTMDAVGAIMSDSMKKIEEAGGKKVAEQFDELSAKAKQLGRTTRYSANEAAEALKFLGMAGFNTNQALAAVESTLHLAAVGKMDLGQAADFASDAVTAFGLRASSLTRVVDVMARTAVNSNTSVIQMGEAFKYAAPIMAVMGVNVEEVATMIGLLGNAGLKGSIAGTSLAQAWTQLAKKGHDMDGVLKKFGMTFSDINPEVHDARDIIEKLAMTSMSAADIIEIFGIRGGKAIAVMLTQARNAPKEFADLWDTVAEVGETTAKSMYEQMEGNFIGGLIILKSQFEGLMISIFESMGGSLAGLAQIISDFIARIQAWVDANQELVGKIAAVVGMIGAFAAVSGVVLIVLGSLAAAISALVALFATLGSVGLPAIMAVIPVIIASMGYFALAVGLVKAVWQELSALFKTIYKSALVPMIEVFKKFGGILMSVLKPAWDWLVKAVKEAIMSMRELIKAMPPIVWKILAGVMIAFLTVALLPILAPILLLAAGIAIVSKVVTILTDGWIRFLRVFGKGKGMRTSAERARDAAKAKRELKKATDEAYVSELLGARKAVALAEKKAKVAELLKLGENANLKQKKELLKLMNDGNMRAGIDINQQKRLIAMQEKGVKDLKARIAEMRRLGIVTKDQETLLSARQKALQQEKDTLKSLVDEDGNRREGLLTNAAALEESIRLEEEMIRVKEASDAATKSLKDSEKDLAALRKILEKEYASSLDGEIEQIEDLKDKYDKLIFARYQDLEAQKKLLELRLARLKIKIANQDEDESEIQTRNKKAMEDEIDALTAQQDEEEDLRQKHNDKVERDKAKILRDADDKRKDMAAKRKIEEAKLSGDIIKQTRLENEQRLVEAKRRIDKELQISKHMSAKQRKDTLEERRRQLDLVEAQNRDRMAKAHKKVEGGREPVKRIEKERDLEMETWKIMLKKVNTLRELYMLHLMMYKLQVMKETRALNASRNLVKAEEKLKQMQAHRARGGKFTPTDREMRLQQVEVEHAERVAASRTANAQQEEGLAQDAKKRMAELQVAFNELETRVRASRAAIKQTIGMIGADFLEAPFLWVEQWLIGWETQSQRMLAAVFQTMHDMNSVMHPDMRASPSLRDIWQMNSDVVQAGVGRMTASIRSASLGSAGVMGGVAPSMGVGQLNDSRKLTMTVNNRVDAAAVTRQIGRAMGKTVAKRGTI
jgi:TP901 family phage tail tape measure protein